MIAYIKAKIKNNLADADFIEIFSHSFYSFIFKVTGLFFGYLFTLLIGRFLGADAMGYFSISFTVLNVAMIFALLGIDNAIVKFISQDKDKLELFCKKTLIIVIVASSFISILLFQYSDFLSENFFNLESSSQLSFFLKIVALTIFPFAILRFFSNVFRGLKRTKEYVLFSEMLPFMAATIFLGVLLFILEPKNIFSVIAFLVGVLLSLIVSIFLWLLTKRNIKIKENKEKTGETKRNLTIKNILNIALPMAFASSMFLIMGYLDKILLGIFSNETSLGIYHICFQIAKAVTLPLFAINSIIAPKFAETYKKGNHNELKKIANQSTKVIFWSSFPILLIIFLFPSFILNLFGEEFIGGIIPLLILGFGFLVNSISGSVGLFLQMTSKEKLFQWILLVAVMINLILNLIFIPKYGIMGAALGTTISMIFWNLVSVLAVRRVFKINMMYLPFLKSKI